jgi:hypothetical protein
MCGHFKKMPSCFMSQEVDLQQHESAIALIVGFPSHINVFLKTHQFCYNSKNRLRQTLSKNCKSNMSPLTSIVWYQTLTKTLKNGKLQANFYHKYRFF